MTDLLQLDGVTVRFGSTDVLREVTLSIAAGTITGLIGPNGAGKTTLIDAVMGFVPVTDGAISFGARDLGDLPPHRRARLGLTRTFQSVELFDDMTVTENVLVAGDPSSLAGVGLVHGDERVAGELGPSDRKTVALARALAGRPSLLLLDEPAAGLDRDERRDLVERIQSIRDGGTTVVLVDHDIELVLEVCDRVVVLDLGAVVYDGPPAGLRTDDRVAAAYLGGAHTHAPEIERDRRFEPAGVPALVRARDVSLAYGDTTVVRNLDFDVRAGERVALLGPNGAGKTTTLLALAGALPTVRGRLEVLGTIKRRAHLLARRGVANVLQDHKVFTSLSAADNLRLAGADRRRREQLREQFPALKRVWNRPAGTLSGGEQQLLALARAVARSPELLLIDELSLGLAPVTVVELFNALADWQVESGCAIVFAEQHIEHALDFADRAYVLNAGRVVLEAAAAELRRRPDLVANAYLGRPDTPESRHDGD